MKQYRATQLEAYRRYIEHEYVTYDEMIATLSGSKQENEAMRFGTAAHKACEMVVQQKERRDLHVLCVDDYVFNRQSLLLATQGVTDDASTEITFTRDCYIGDELVQLRGTCDVVQGNVVMDYKNTMRSIDDNKLRSYEDSYQWRAYLTLTGCPIFVYNVMQWKQDDNIWYIAQNEFVTCKRYIGMVDDVERMLRSLHEFAIKHGVA